MRQVPHQEIRNRAVIDGVTQLLRTDAPLHPQTDFSLERSIQDVPGFGFAVRQSGRLRIDIIRMNLDGKWMTRKQSFNKSAGGTAVESERSYQISPIVFVPSPALLQGLGSKTPQGFDTECAWACSIVITLASYVTEIAFFDAQHNQEKTLAESVSLLSGTTRSYFSAMFLMR